MHYAAAQLCHLLRRPLPASWMASHHAVITGGGGGGGRGGGEGKGKGRGTPLMTAGARPSPQQRRRQDNPRSRRL